MRKSLTGSEEVFHVDPGEEHCWQRQHLKGLKVRTYLSYKTDTKEANVAGIEYLKGRVAGCEVKERKGACRQGVGGDKTF